MILVAVPGVLGGLACSPDRGAQSTEANTAQVASPSTGSRYPAAPFLEEMEESVLFGQIWKRPGLSERDRAMITVAVTQALYQTEALREYLNRALDAGVTPDEVSELITHVTMYAGWPAGSNASRVVADVYQARGVAFPPAADPVSMEIDLRGQDPNYPGLPYLSALTRSVLFDETNGVWSRPGLSPRDRSMVTIAVAQASFASDQLRGHLGRALNNGLTPAEIGEVITHVTFYSGWPSGVNAASIAGEVFAERNVSIGQ
jgi:4-carboxymuconolactone decarboxylase